MKKLRADFPIFQTKNREKPLIYFDNAATVQKPQPVLDAVIDFYAYHNANIHRGVYALTEDATMRYEQARATVANFIGAHPHEIVFTRSTTESINLVAATWAEQSVQADDEIVITELEHHSNLLPWQRLAQKKGAKLVYIPVTTDGILDLTNLDQMITDKTKLVSVSQVSNALGTHNDIQFLIDAAHAVGAKILIDAAQSVPHQAINVHALNCDFLAFSGHKIMAPTGIGVLYIAQKLHDQFPPYQLGGGMVYEADFYSASWLPVPQRLEAGTPAIGEALGLEAALNYCSKNIDFDELKGHEAALCTALIGGLVALKGVTIHGPIEQLKNQGHLVSFSVPGVHPHDVAAYLDKEGICVRAGHHCAQPLAKRLGIDSSVRVSFYAYNELYEVQSLLDALSRLAGGL